MVNWRVQPGRRVREEEVVIVAQVGVAALALDVWADAELHVAPVVGTTANEVVSYSSTLKFQTSTEKKK